MAEWKQYSFIRKYGIFYLIVAVSVLGLKWYNSSAGCSTARWILAPTAWWAGILSGYDFIYEPQIGYVNHSLRFIIAPSCSGIQFLTIVFAVLAGAFVHRMGTRTRGLCWLAGCAAAAVLLTVFVNGMRIALSVFVPGMFFAPGAEAGWMTPKRLHTITGVAVYFPSLLAIYGMADRVSGKMGEGVPKQAGWGLPVVAYGLVVLGIPLFHGALRDNREQFSGYAVLVTAVCVIVLCLLRGIAFWRRRFDQRTGRGK